MLPFAINPHAFSPHCPNKHQRCSQLLTEHILESPHRPSHALFEFFPYLRVDFTFPSPIHAKTGEFVRLRHGFSCSSFIAPASEQFFVLVLIRLCCHRQLFVLLGQKSLRSNLFCNMTHCWEQ